MLPLDMSLCMTKIHCVLLVIRVVSPGELKTLKVTHKIPMGKGLLRTVVVLNRVSRSYGTIKMPCILLPSVYKGIMWAPRALPEQT